MKQTIKTILFTMVIAILLGTAATAAEPAVAAIGKKNYTSLESALAAVKKGQTIQLKKSISVDQPLELKRNTKYTLDLNGKTLTFKNSSSHGDLVISKGTVTLKGGRVKGAVLVKQGARLDVKNGTFAQIINEGTTTLYNGKFTGKNDPVLVNLKGKMTIKKGTVRSNYYGLYMEGGSVEITGGDFKNYDKDNQQPLLGVVKGTLTINGGKFQNNNCVLYNKGGKVSVKKGTLTSSKAFCVVNETSLTISGGTIKCTGSKVGECALFARKGSTTQMKKGTVSGKKTAVFLETGVSRFKLTGGKISNSSKDYPPVLVDEKKSSRISVKTRYISTKCKLKIYYEG